MKLFNIVFWEFVQNVPVIVLFMAAVWLWARRDKPRALVCMAIGAAAGSLAIRFTESLKTMSDYVEPIEVTLVNVVLFGLLQIPFTAYLGVEARWSNWKTDALLGGLAGMGIALAQGLASPGSPRLGVVLHSLSLGVAGGLVMVAIRALKGRTLGWALVGSVAIIVVMTLTISAIDYSYLLLLGG